MRQVRKDFRVKIEKWWNSWKAAELGIGYKKKYRTRHIGWDRTLAKLIQDRNACRRKRNELKGEERKAMSEELKRYRKLAKQKEYELRMKEIKTKNERILKLRTRNPKEYWKILKKITGINIHKTLPDELLGTEYQ